MASNRTTHWKLNIARDIIIHRCHHAGSPSCHARVVQLLLVELADQPDLVGQVSPLLALDHLEHLDLSENELEGPTGHIPKFLGSLKYLNLSGILLSTASTKFSQRMHESKCMQKLLHNVAGFLFGMKCDIHTLCRKSCNITASLMMTWPY